MKQVTLKLVKSPATYIVGWFIIIGFLAALLTSCRSYSTCDAYGDNNDDTPSDVATVQVAK